jgi:hypothetical protein
MAIPTLWTIEHTCGHSATRDLSDRPADRRAGFADWLTRQPCTDCWRARNQEDHKAREIRLAERRATEQQEAEDWARTHRLPPLDGSDRAVPWAVRCRHQLLAAAYTILVVEGDLDEAAWQEVEDAARTISRAGWWLDQRNADPADLPELLEAATERGTENPFA